jgi:hypothetical protein
MKKVKEPKGFYHCFEVGDLVINQDKKKMVILEVCKGEYKFMRLDDDYINIIGEPRRIYLKKGETASQPCSQFDKYYYLYEV